MKTAFRHLLSFHAILLLTSCDTASWKPATSAGTRLQVSAMDAVVDRQMRSWALDRRRLPTIESADVTRSLKNKMRSGGTRVLDLGDAVLVTLPGSSTFTQARRDRLTDQAVQTMGHVASLMQVHPSLRAAVVGHVSGSSHAASDMILSERRAVSLKAALMAHGVEACRIAANGRGADDHLAVPISQRRAQANDRVEILLVTTEIDSCSHALN